MVSQCESFVVLPTLKTLSPHLLTETILSELLSPCHPSTHSFSALKHHFTFHPPSHPFSSSSQWLGSHFSIVYYSLPATSSTPPLVVTHPPTAPLTPSNLSTQPPQLPRNLKPQLLRPPPPPNPLLLIFSLFPMTSFTKSSHTPLILTTIPLRRVPSL